MVDTWDLLAGLSFFNGTLNTRRNGTSLLASVSFPITPQPIRLSGVATSLSFDNAALTSPRVSERWPPDLGSTGQVHAFGLNHGQVLPIVFPNYGFCDRS